jgi:hypothetical protein
MEATSMHSFLWIAAIGAFLSGAVLWDLAMVAALRSFRIKLPFSLPFHFYTRLERDLLAALKGRPLGAYVLISGFLLFACPLFVGFTAYDYIVRRYVDHSTFGLDYVVGSCVICAITGVWVGVTNWKKSAAKGIGSAS